MRQHPEIAIIGAGPGGLVLARILHLNGIAAEVFERDAGPLARPQGGSLDMHIAGGLRALRSAGLENDFRQVARYEDQGNKVYRPDGTLLFEDANLSGDRPEIDRSHLRRLLIDALPPGTIHWGKRVEKVLPAEGPGFDVFAENSERQTFDLVVGADGAWSCVRPLLSKDTAHYEGVTIVELGIDNVDKEHPTVSALVGRGKMFAKGIGKTLVAQRNANAHLRIYAALRADEDAVALDLNDPARARQELSEMFADFSPMLRSVIDVGTLIAVRPMYALPVGHRWKTRDGLTLIGDAAHLMSPFGGEGANSALADGADLAQSLARGDDWRRAVATYEAIMFPRSEAAARDASEGMSGAVSFDAPEHVYEHIAAAQERAVRQSSGVSSLRPRDLLETRIAETVRNPDAQKTINAAYRFDLSGPDGGSWIIDFRPQSAGVREGEEPAQCTIAMTDHDFVEMLSGDADPRTVFMTGKLKVRGDMKLAMKLSSMLAS